MSGEENVDLYAGERDWRRTDPDSVPMGAFDRMRFRWSRRRARARAQWNEYLGRAVPRDDDGPEELPSWLRGVPGRIVFGLGTVAVMSGWGWLVWALVSR